MRRIRSVGWVVVLVLAAALVPVRADEIHGTWRSKTSMFGGSVRFDLQTDDGAEIRLSLEPDEFDGLSLDDLKTTGTPLDFGWSRDPATLRFEGEGRWFGRPSGTFVLEPHAEFVGALERIGGRRPSARELLDLALHDVTLETAAALAEAGYRSLAPDDLSRLAIHGIGAPYIAAMQGQGRRPSPDELVRLRVHGVSFDEVAELSRLGLTGIPVDTLIRYRNHGIGPRYLRGMADAGYPPDRVDAIIRLNVHGYGPEQVAALREVEGFELSVDELITLRNHGIGPDYLAGLAQAEGVGLSVDDVVRLNIHGVETEFLQRLTDAGHVGISVDEIIRLHRQGTLP